MTPIRVTLGLLPLLAIAALTITGCGTAMTTRDAARPVVPANKTNAGWAATARRAVPPTGPVKITVSQVSMPDGSLITIATFRGPVQYVLHNGSEDPGPLAGPVKAGPQITGTERQRLLAAFNGGFKLDALAGGYEQEGHVVRALRGGLASLVIDTSGQATVGVWGKSVPVTGERVYSVRQNLWPLVAGGQPTPESARWWRWGGTLGHTADTARSAVAENAAGDLMYAASMSATPADLAAELARSGARTAMELDINPEWVQLDTARHPGGPLSPGVPGQHRPADQYLAGWTRDFITVLSPGT